MFSGLYFKDRKKHKLIEKAVENGKQVDLIDINRDRFAKTPSGGGAECLGLQLRTHGTRECLAGNQEVHAARVCQRLKWNVNASCVYLRNRSFGEYATWDVSSTNWNRATAQIRYTHNRHTTRAPSPRKLTGCTRTESRWPLLRA